MFHEAGVADAVAFFPLIAQANVNFYHAILVGKLVVDYEPANHVPPLNKRNMRNTEAPPVVNQKPFHMHMIAVPKKKGN